ncbi:MAG: hypothetical protein J6S53_03070 [Lentisphaeria bacterium]|nr:hypothetical protein [Lentisphaeria bacterium]
MSYKIAFIGGGSVLWTPRLSSDMFMEKSLQGSEIVLVDIDPSSMIITEKYLKELNKRLDSKWTIRTGTREEALDNADIVIVSISTGGFDAMHLDYTIPEKYGIYHTVSDTVGPGGIARSLRNIPVFLDIAKDMARLCPDATMLHVTNPLTQLTRAVNRSGLVKCCGLCHEYIAILGFMQKYFRLENFNDVDGTCMGVNHFTLLTDLSCKGIKNPMEKLSLSSYVAFEDACKEERLSGTVDDEVKKAEANKTGAEKYPYYINFHLFDQYGKCAFPAAGAPHMCENFPFFNSSPEYLDKLNVRRKGVLPNRPKRKLERRAELAERLESGVELPEMKQRSRETLADAVVGLCSGEARRIIATLPNKGQITNLPHEACVETWATVSKGGITPHFAGEIPAAYRSFMEAIVREQELTVEAAMTGDRNKVVEAMLVSPMVADKFTAEKLADELLAAHKSYLPQFKF